LGGSPLYGTALPRRPANNGLELPQLWSLQHGLRGCIYLCRSRPFLRCDNRIDRASLDIAAGVALHVGAGIRILIASQIVIVLGYAG
jgi:hypothetical protein